MLISFVLVLGYESAQLLDLIEQFCRRGVANGINLAVRLYSVAMRDGPSSTLSGIASRKQVDPGEFKFGGIWRSNKREAHPGQ
jgi:hypothetical protein